MIHGQTVVALDDRTCVTGAEFAGLVYRLARALSRHGIDDATTLLVIGHRTVEQSALRHAAALLGAEVHLCDTAEPSHQLAERSATDDVVVLSQRAADTVAESVHRLWARFAIGLGPVRGCDLDILAAADEEPAEPVADRSSMTAVRLLRIASASTLD